MNLERCIAFREMLAEPQDAENKIALSQLWQKHIGKCLPCRIQENQNAQR